MKVTGLVYWVLDNQVSEKFYKKIGFKIVESNERHTILTLDDFELTLVSIRDETEFAEDAMTSGKGKGSYLYVKVGDVDELYNKLTGAALETSSVPRDWGWGNREFVIKDPDGGAVRPVPV